MSFFGRSKFRGGLFKSNFVRCKDSIYWVIGNICFCQKDSSNHASKTRSSKMFPISKKNHVKYTILMTIPQSISCFPFPGWETRGEKVSQASKSHCNKFCAQGRARDYSNWLTSFAFISWQSEALPTVYNAIASKWNDSQILSYQVFHLLRSCRTS